jgi:hypothetical protein
MSLQFDADPVVAAEPEPNRQLFAEWETQNAHVTVRDLIYSKYNIVSSFLGGSAGLGQPAADIDIFVDGSAAGDMFDKLAELFVENGYITTKGARYSDSDFLSFRKDLVNIILIDDEKSYHARERAFQICKYLVQTMNVYLNKENRKMIHKIAAGEADA